MPTLSEAHKQHIVKAVEAHWKSPRYCGLCRGTSFSFVGIEELRTYNGTPSATVLAEPVVSVSCQTCGHVLLFNAVVLGLVDSHTGKLTFQTPPEVSC